MVGENEEEKQLDEEAKNDNSDKASELSETSLHAPSDEEMSDSCEQSHHDEPAEEEHS